MRIIAIIPARYASTRLPGKPLLSICDKPMIQHVYENARQAEGLDDVFVATDDVRVADAVQAFGGKFLMTSSACTSGSDRVNDATSHVPADIYINIQGDEPLLRPESISTLVQALRADASIQVATLCCRIDSATAQCPHIVKVVCDDNDDALYFSRAPIPFLRETSDTPDYWGHMGIYAYRADILKKFAALPLASLEHIEKLEQLRLLQAGIPIRVLKTTFFGQGVDTPQDLEDVRRVMGHYGDTAKTANSSLSDILRSVKLIITDIDGVLTDGTLFYGADGETLKAFNVRDGLGIRLLQKGGVEVAVLSGRSSLALEARLRDLNIRHYVLGELAKEEACKGIMQKAGVSSEHTLFVGDDLPDAIAFKSCAVGVAVADAVSFVKEKAAWVLQTKGGAGALREIADAVLQAQGREDLLAPAEDLQLNTMDGKQ